MHDFGAVCYLDVPKTGSSFVSHFLNEHMREPAVEFGKHRRVQDPNAARDGKLYFISCREPLAQYMSLYRYGLSGKGAIRSRLNDVAAASRSYQGRGEHFSDWLRFVLDPQNHTFFDKGYTARAARLVGFQTFRFLVLSFDRPRVAFRQMRTREDVVRVYSEKKLHTAIVRQEHLQEDLAALCRGPLGPHLKDRAAAIAALQQESARINASKEVPLVPDEDALALVAEREWFAYDVLGYQRPTTAQLAESAATPA